MVTLTEVARLSGVSASTVSNVLNGRSNVGEATKQRVLQVVKETGYERDYYASGMRKLTSDTIGIVAEDLSEYTMPIVERIMAGCDDEGYRTMLINLRMYDKWKDAWYYDDTRIGDALRPAMVQFRSAKVAGVVYIGGHCRIVRVLSEYKDIPIVAAYGIAADQSIPSVIIDDEKGGYDIARYLISMGHKDIGIIAGRETNLHTQDRLKGVMKAFHEEGLTFNPNRVFYGNWKRDGGYEGAVRLMQNPPTAVLCFNDYMAAGMYEYCRERSITVGKDISVTGYDDVDISDYLYPKLTTCRIELDLIGRDAAKVLLSRISSTSEAKSTKQNSETSEESNILKVPCELVLRDSVVDLSKK